MNETTRTAPKPATPRTGTHVCPVWVGYLLANPLRRLVENPETLLRPHVRPGMTALDLGCAMGFFSLPLARMVGRSGRVVCVDLQEAMLRRLRRRAIRAGLDGVIETRCCNADSLGLEDLAGKADLALALHVVHEVPDPRRFLAETHAALRAGGTLLLAEPKGHVSDADRAALLALAEEVGFRSPAKAALGSRRPAVLRKG
jgi:ubiquinone/menaquinone biosynthesis C-methylase UbiE